jgi:hypothetical protein
MHTFAYAASLLLRGAFGLRLTGEQLARNKLNEIIQPRMGICLLDQANGEQSGAHKYRRTLNMYSLCCRPCESAASKMDAILSRG